MYQEAKQKQIWMNTNEYDTNEILSFMDEQRKYKNQANQHRYNPEGNPERNKSKEQNSEEQVVGTRMQ